MGFSSLIQSLDHVCLNTFGLAGDGVIVQFAPQSGSGTQVIDGIQLRSLMDQDQNLGANVVRLFVSFSDLVPRPQQGDRIAINSFSYDVLDVTPDSAGGAILKLRAL